MNKQLKEKFIESLKSVMPISLIVLLLCVTLTPMAPDTLMLFLAGAALLVIGMGLFTLGADMAMMPIGEKVGLRLSKSKKLITIIIACFLIGVIITLAEPDLQVLADKTPSIPTLILMLSVAVGVGIFLVIAFLKRLFNWNISTLLIIFYSIIFIIAIFVPNEFIPVAFDSGGVTTGPITVPFIMALGIGLTTASKSRNENDSFGLIALCSVGPVLSVLILGLIFKSPVTNESSFEIPTITSTRELMMKFGSSLPEYAFEVLKSIFPIAFFFVIFQFIFFKLRRKQLIKIIVGLIYTFIGLTLFLTGVNIGFMPTGNFIGSQLALLDYRAIIIPIGMVIGYFIVRAEPAVAVLNKQVEDVSNGSITEKMMMSGLSIGMAISIGLSMVRVLTGISIFWFLVPGYALALGLSFVVPKIFTSIAFDSGGVASGPMTATFLLPFAMGACSALSGGDTTKILTNAFGVVSMVAMTPLIIIQLMGFSYKLRTKHKQRIGQQQEEVIIDLEV